MPVAATDLVQYLSANMPTTDAATSGGAIDTAGRPEFTQLTANAVAAVVSDGADTRTVTVTGRLASGVIDNEVLTLNGTTEVVGAKTWERILTIVLSGTSGTRTVTVKQGAGGATRATIGINETSRKGLFYDSASGASSTDRYEKTFWKNNHGTLALSSAAVKIPTGGDPAARLKIALATAKGDTGSVTNRLTAPATITFVDDNVSVAVPTGALAAGETIGLWYNLTLPSNDPPVKNTITTELSGTTV
jgi:hypothetical protein